MTTGHHHFCKLEPFGAVMNAASHRPRNRTDGHHTEHIASPEVRLDTKDANIGADKSFPHQHGVDESLVRRASNVRPVWAFEKDLGVAAVHGAGAVALENAACNSPRNMDPLTELESKKEEVDA
jgi:hypothetical protein